MKRKNTQKLLPLILLVAMLSISSIYSLSDKQAKAMQLYFKHQQYCADNFSDIEMYKACLGNTDVDN